MAVQTQLRRGNTLSHSTFTAGGFPLVKAQDLTTANVTEVSNQYFTNTRSISAFTSGTGVTIAANGLITVAVAPTYTDSNTYANVSLLGLATTFLVMIIILLLLFYQ
jgi:hypothetical protein